MLSDTTNFDVAEEFYSFGNGGQELEDFSKANLLSADDTFGVGSDNLFDTLCPSETVPQWLTQSYNLEGLESSLELLNPLEEPLDFDSPSLSTSPCSSTASFDCCSSSPTPSDDGLIESPCSTENELAPTASSVDMQSLFDLINMDQVSSTQTQSTPADVDVDKETSQAGPIRCGKVGTVHNATPYQKPSQNGRKRPVKTPEQKSRKKCQNRNAATRYRMKKKDEYSDLFNEATELESKNASLKDKVSGLQTEIDYLKSLMLDVIKARLAKGQATTTPTVPKGSIVITNSSLIQTKS